MRILLVAMLLFLFMPYGMADEGEPSDDSGPQLTPSSDGAAVSFSELKEGDVVPTTFTVKFMVSGMGVAPAGSQIDNTGHHHLLIDVDELPPMDQPLPATDQIKHFGGGQTETELTLAPGEHSLQLVFADYAHRPHDPPVVSDKITIIVSAEAIPASKEDEE